MGRTSTSRWEIAAVRRFNRFYTREVGLLRKTFLDTPWTLGEMRVLYEIRHESGLTATEIARRLDLDTAYLSRLLSRLEKQKLVSRQPSAEDGRRYQLELTARGLATFNLVDARQAMQTETTLQRLTAAQRNQLIEAMVAIETLLDRKPESS